jgi:hypothetical protein
MATRSDIERPRGKRRPPWILIALGCFVLVVAAVIFSAAGPDRSRTEELKGTSPYGVNPPNATTRKIEPNVDMPTAPKSR